MTVVVFLLPLLGAAAGQTREAEALRVLDDFMAAFNDQDLEGMAAVYHYPHVRIGGGAVSVWETAEEVTTPESRAGLERSLKAMDWHRSAWESREVLQSSADKVHILVRCTRYRDDDSVIGTYDSLWIVTKRDGRWGIQARSSFAGAEEEAAAPEGPCAWYEWRTLMEGFPPHPEGAQITKAKRKTGSIKRPHSMITHRIDGEWIVEAVVDEKGKVRDARVKAMPWIDPPWPAYEQAIIKSILKWRFEPGTVDGEPRPSCRTITFPDKSQF
jgi:hypothetical protein